MVPDFLECPLCMEPFSKVIETPCCHRCYCVGCLTQWLIKPNNKTCPGCRAKLESVDSCVPNIPFQRLADDLPSVCTYAEKGCKDKITRGILEEHIKACDYRSVICEYGKDQCPPLLKKDLPEHHQKCPWRPFTCPLCSTDIVLHLLESHQSTTCPMAIVPCSNPECHDKTITRDKLKEHLENHCLYQNAPCPFSSYGCTFQSLRGMMDHHLQEVALDHLKTALIHLKKNERFNEKLMSKVVELQKANEELVFGMDQLSALKPILTHSPYATMPVVLPSYLKDHCSKLVAIYGEKRNIAGIKPKSGTFSIFGNSEPQTVIITADRPVPTLLPGMDKMDIPYYFEMTVTKLGEDTGFLSIGLFGEGDSMKGYLGSGPHSYGLNILQQKVYNSGKGKSYAGMFPNNSVGTYGCGWDQKTGNIFFTVGGSYGATGFKGVKGKLKPAICISSPGTEVEVNFGAYDFEFNVNVAWKYFHEIEVKFEECEDKGICSYIATHVNYFPQLMYGCKTCALVGHFGMCKVCAQVCHTGHDLVPSKVALFFCDCGHLTDTDVKKKDMCKCLKEHIFVKV